MADIRSSLRQLRSDHPLFFWGMTSLGTLLLVLTLAVAFRIPQYSHQMAAMDRRLSGAERETRDGILHSRTRRSQLALALLQREMRLKALQEKAIHLAIDTQESTLALRHGAATLRTVPIAIGGDSLITAPDGRTWRFVLAQGERHLRAKENSPTVTIPEWVYISRGEAVPPEDERRRSGAGGRFVLTLDDGTEIYSRPEEGPFASQVKPGTFMAEEDDLEAIFDAIGIDTPVYIY